MNKVTFYFIVSIATLSLFSCSKDDSTTTITPPREYKVQYTTDSTDIAEYLNNYYLDMDLTDPNFADKDVVISKIPVGGIQASIMSYENNVGYPKLLHRDVPLHGITYKLYYLVLREGIGTKPCNVDGVMVAYRGDYLQKVTTDNVTTLTATNFDEVKSPQQFLSLTEVVTGWGEIFPQFKTGTYTPNPTNGTVSYSGFGAGVMFIPSGLAYYNYGKGKIPGYVPLVFSFKLYEIQRSDYEIKMVLGKAVADPDGIPSYLEDINGDGYIYDYRNTNLYPTTPNDEIRYADDTDRDGVPDFIDIDDDGDNYTTKLEIKNPLTGLPYPFENIPSCDGDITNPTRIKKYLDKNCH